MTPDKMRDTHDSLRQQLFFRELRHFRREGTKEKKEERERQPARLHTPRASTMLRQHTWLSNVADLCQRWLTCVVGDKSYAFLFLFPCCIKQQQPWKHVCLQAQKDSLAGVHAKAGIGIDRLHTASISEFIVRFNLIYKLIKISGFRCYLLPPLQRHPTSKRAREC